MAWIIVPIVCLVEDAEADEVEETNNLLEKLDLPIKKLPERGTEIRFGRINTKHIVVHYPNIDKKETIVECTSGETYSIALSNDEFITLIDGKKKNTGTNRS